MGMIKLLTFGAFHTHWTDGALKDGNLVLEAIHVDGDVCTVSDLWGF
jgi:hypothetical protein